MEIQSSQNNKFTEYFLKNKRAGQICPERAKAEQIWPRSRTAAVPFEPTGGAWLSVAPGYRIGTRRPWLSD
jgi:hypothetical protein